MKKLIATTLCLGLVGTAAFAQGLVSVGNSSTTDFYTSLGGSNVNTSGSATTLYDYEVLTAASTVAPVGALSGYGAAGGSLAAVLASPWSDTSLFFHNSALAGRVTAPTGSTVLNWPSSTGQDYIIIGWSASIGSWSTVSAALAGATLAADSGDAGLHWTGPGLAAYNGDYIGATIVGDVITGAEGSGSGPNLFGAQASGVSPVNTTTALYLVSVPEPTTFAMLGLGAASLMIFRRRK
jgi:hypothetical protein